MHLKNFLSRNLKLGGDDCRDKNVIQCFRFYANIQLQHFCRLESHHYVAIATGIYKKTHLFSNLSTTGLKFELTRRVLYHRT